jgi:hypothetical protein
LAEVRVTATGPRTLAELAFEERRRRGRGTFLTAEDLQRMAQVSARTLQGRSTGLRTTGGTSPRLQMRRSAHSSDPCLPDFYVDGERFGAGLEGWEEAMLLQRAIRLEIYKADEIPIEYFGSTTCGLVMIWTR